MIMVLRAPGVSTVMSGVVAPGMSVSLEPVTSVPASRKLIPTSGVFLGSDGESPEAHATSMDTAEKSRIRRIKIVSSTGT